MHSFLLNFLLECASFCALQMICELQVKHFSWSAAHKSIVTSSVLVMKNLCEWIENEFIFFLFFNETVLLFKVANGKLSIWQKFSQKKICLSYLQNKIVVYYEKFEVKIVHITMSLTYQYFTNVLWEQWFILTKVIFKDTLYNKIGQYVKILKAQ